jgi:ATP-binding cassette subfamily C protein
VLALIAANSGTGGLVSIPVVGELALSTERVSQLAILITSVFLAKSVSSIALHRVSGRLIARFEHSASKVLLAEIYSYDGIRSNSSLNLEQQQSLMVVALNALFSGVLGSWLVFISEASLLIVITTGFAIVNPPVTLALVLYLGSITGILTFFIGSRLTKTSKYSYHLGQTLLSKIADTSHVVRELLLSGKIAQRNKDIASSAHLYARQSSDLSFFGSLPRYLIEASLIIAVAALFGYVSVASDFKSSAGTLGIFIAGGMRLLAAILPLQSSLSSILAFSAKSQSAMLALEKAQKAQTIEASQQVTETELPGPLGVRVDSLSLEKENHSNREINLLIHPGWFTVILGKSGIGKTTLFETILNFKPLQSGKISFFHSDNVLLTDIHAGMIGYVPQRPHLISGTFLENITFEAEANVEKKRFEEIIRILDLDKVIARLPLGIATYLKPNSSLVSGGEVQRIGIARALYLQPRILFLDEATSALDGETSDRILSYLQTMKDNCSIVLITHSTANSKFADEVFTLS